MDPDTLRTVLSPLSLPENELRAWSEALQTPPMPALRINRLGRSIRPKDLPYKADPVPWYPDDGFQLREYHRLGGHPLFGAGAYFVQDAGSMLAVRLLDPQPGETVLDLCAAPGGKSTAILDRIEPTGLLLANETIRTRIGGLLLNLVRHGGTRYLVSARDSKQLADSIGDAFDAVLVDAPCSGQTVFADGKPDPHSFEFKRIEHNATRQDRILREAARLVRPGGRLVYSTCTYSFLENEQRVVDFLAARDDFHFEPYEPLAAYQSPCADVSGCYRLLPHRDRGCGAFAARLRRKGPEQDAPNHARPLIDSVLGLRVVRKTDVDWSNWGVWSVDPDWVTGGNGLFTMPEDAPHAFRRLARSAPEVAFKKGSTWFPAYALAMRRDGLFKPHTVVDLKLDQASQYLQGNPIKGKQTGWVVVTYRNRPLGWAKGNGKVLNNNLPKSARLIPDANRRDKEGSDG